MHFFTTFHCLRIAILTTVILTLGILLPAQITLEKDINQDPADSEIMNAYFHDGFMYFQADEGDYGTELWEWNIATDEMRRLTDIKPLEENSSPHSIIVYQNKVYFESGTTYYAYDLETDELATVSSLYSISLQEIGNAIVYANKLHVSAGTFGNGKELVVLDGSDFSYQIYDLNPGTANSFPVNFNEYEGDLYFSATGSNMQSLWKWNLSLDIPEQLLSANGESYGSGFRQFLIIDDIVYFPGFQQGKGDELFYYDLLTKEGGLLVDFYIGLASSSPVLIHADSESLYFLARSSAVPRSLQKLNRETLEIETFLLNNDGDQETYQAVYYENAIYVDGLTTQYERDIWKFDLDLESFTLVHDYPDLPLQYLSEMFIIDNRILSTSRTEQAGVEWSSYDLIGNSLTAPVVDINTKTEGSDPSQFVSHRGNLYFEAFDFKTGSELFVYNPTTGNTGITIENLVGSSGTKPSYMTSYGSKLYLSGLSLGAGDELLSYDPITNEMDLLADIYEGNASSQPFYFMPADGKIYVEANSNVEGREIFAWDTLTNEISLAYESEAGMVDGSKGDMWLFNGKIYFEDYDLEIFYQYNPATNEVKDLSEITGVDLGRNQFVNGIWGDRLYFTSRDDSNIRTQKIWDESDNDLTIYDNPSSYGIANGETAMLDGTLYLTGQFSPDGNQLWRLDPESGFERLTDYSKFNPRYPTIFDDRVFFSAEDEEYGKELWVYDIAQDTAYIFADIRKGARSSDPEQLYVFNEKLYFSADDGDVGAELWSVASCLNLVVNTIGTELGQANGSIELLIEGGIPPYEITWSTGSTEKDLQNLEEGTYTATVRDSSGCISTIVAQIESFSSTIAETEIAIRISPNPATDVLSIVTDSKEPIQIYNSVGIMVYSIELQGKSMIELEITDFTPGLYILQQGKSNVLWMKQ